jgi:predicted transcriptional regulator
MEVTPTDRELEALKVLWHQGEATVRDICDRMNQATAPLSRPGKRVGGEGTATPLSRPGRGAGGEGRLAYTTVLSLLQVMEQKGLVGHRQRGRAYTYSAKVERQSVFQQLAGGFLDKVFDGAVDQYLVHALESRRVSAEELDRLEKMIAEAKARPEKQHEEGHLP